MIYSYKGTKIEASSKEEAIVKIIAGDDYITVEHIDKDNYKKYIGKKVNVNGDVDLSFLRLKKIPIIFGIVKGNFDCSHNKLITLDGCPSMVGKYFECSKNSKDFTKDDVRKACIVKRSIFTNEDDYPIKVHDVPKIKSLNGAPSKI